MFTQVVFGYQLECIEKLVGQEVEIDKFKRRERFTFHTEKT